MQDLSPPEVKKYFMQTEKENSSELFYPLEKKSFF